MINCPLCGHAVEVIDTNTRRCQFCEMIFHKEKPNVVVDATDVKLDRETGTAVFRVTNDEKHGPNEQS